MLKLKYENVKNYIFYIMIFLLGLRFTIGDSVLLGTLDTYGSKLLSFFILLCSILLILYNAYSLKEILLLTLFGVLSFYTSYLIGNTWLIYLCIIAFSIKGKNFKTAVKILFFIKVSIITLHILVFLYFFIVDRTSLQIVELYTKNRTQYLCFFKSQNVLGQYIIFSILDYFLLKKGKIKVFTALVFIFLTLFCWYFTGSDNVVLCISLLMFLTFCITFLPQSKKIIFFLSKYGFIILSIFFVCIILMMTNPNPEIPGFKYVNSLMSGRLSMGYQALKIYGFTFLGNGSQFGRMFTYEGLSIWQLFVDNAYLYFCVHVGWFYLIVLCKLFVVSTKQFTITEAVVVIIFYVYSMAENNILYAITFMPILLAVDSIVNRKKTEIFEEKENHQTG